jgi:hypothetical protein
VASLSDALAGRGGEELEDLVADAAACLAEAQEQAGDLRDQLIVLETPPHGWAELDTRTGVSATVVPVISSSSDVWPVLCQPLRCDQSLHCVRLAPYVDSRLAPWVPCMCAVVGNMLSLRCQHNEEVEATQVCAKQGIPNLQPRMLIIRGMCACMC